MKKIKKWIPLTVILFLMVLAYSLGVLNYFTFENLHAHRNQMVEFTSTHFLVASLIYILVYALSVSLSFPVGIFLSLLGGFLFPQPYSTLYIVIGATLGACVLFLAAKTAFGDFLKKRAGRLWEKIGKGFHKNAASYLLFLRLVPLFPFWLVNLAPAFFGVTFWTFIWTTFLGIIPGAFVYAQVGNGLGVILDANQGFTWNAVLNPEVKIALFALGCLALVPILIRRILDGKS